MAYKDPEKLRKYQRDYARKWRREHRERARETSRNWRAANPDKVARHKRDRARRNELARKRWAENPEKYRKIQVQRCKDKPNAYKHMAQKTYRKYREQRLRDALVYYMQNKDCITKRARKRYSENPEKYRKRAQARRRTHPEEARAGRRKRRARRFAAACAPGLTYVEWERTLRRQPTFVCFWCHVKHRIDHLHIDHVVPLSLSGSDDLSNVVASCHNRNMHKGRLNPVEWINRIAWEPIATTDEGANA